MKKKLLTGDTDGIGLATAKSLASQGYGLNRSDSNDTAFSAFRNMVQIIPAPCVTACIPRPCKIK